MRVQFLTNFTEDLHSENFKKNGVFFAFSKSQFAEQADRSKKYVSIGGGGYCPAENANQAIDDLNDSHAKGIELDKAHHEELAKYRFDKSELAKTMTYQEAIKQGETESGAYIIVARELWNHEAFYTCETESTKETLEDYGYKGSFITAVYYAEMAKQENEDCF